jgi:hypothetical protein
MNRMLFPNPMDLVASATSNIKASALNAASSIGQTASMIVKPPEVSELVTLLTSLLLSSCLSMI